MPDRVNWPPVPRRIVTAALTLAYAMISVAGAATIADSTQRLSVRFGTPMVLTIGVVALVGGAIAAVQTLRQRWKSELRAVAGMGGALLAYNVFDWWLVLAAYPDISIRGPAVVTATWALLVVRGGLLYVLSEKATLAKKVGDKRFREAL